MEQNMGKAIEETAEKLKNQGIPERTSAYAASMGFLRVTKKKGKR